MRRSFVFLTILTILCFGISAFAETMIELDDPKGDDKGTGNYVYPTDPVYAAGSFDLLGCNIEDQGDEIEFEVMFDAPVTFSWGDKWDVQQIQIYLDFDNKPNSGRTATLPGTQLAVHPDCAWEKLIFIDPHDESKINQELELKAKNMMADVIVPSKLKPMGKKIKATVKKSELGTNTDISQWGYGVLMLSATGFPANWSILARRVNEFEGQHRFGGGADGAGDPNVADMIVHDADGSKDEEQKQYDMLSDYVSGMDPMDTSGDKLAVITFVYPGKDVKFAEAEPAQPTPAPKPPKTMASPKAGKPGPRQKLDIAGKLYTQYRWTNASGANYWVSENFGGYSAGPTNFPQYGRHDKKFGNFMRSEAEVEFNAMASRYVRLYLRFKTIFNSNETGGLGEHSASSWADDWDNTRGFLKLRGFLINLNPEFGVDFIDNYVDRIELGTPMGLPFNRWFVADRRYIDRDNLKGIVFRGNGGEMVEWNIARMWNATYMGPAWGGINEFKTEDATYAMNLMAMLSEQMTLDFNTMWYSDANLNPKDFDSPNYNPDLDEAETEDDMDGNITRDDDYNQLGLALNLKYDVSEAMSLEALGMFTKQMYPDRMDLNEDNIADPLAWVGHDTPPHWWGTNEPYADVSTMNGILTFRSTDPFGNGVSPRFEVFYLDHNLYNPYGSRREHDMLLMHGGINPIRYTAADDGEGQRQHQSLVAFLYDGGQSATNVALTDNNFLRLGETFYESPIGYMGGTFDLGVDLDMVSLNAQFNYILATDNNDGAIDEEDENYEGVAPDDDNPDGHATQWYYQKPRDFSGMVGDFSAKTKVNDYGLGFIVKYGMWADVKANADESDGIFDVEMNAMVAEFMVEKQLTDKLNLEIRPRYQQVIFTESYDAGDNEYTNNDIVLRHKWVYAFGGFDFWLRGEHFMRTFSQEPAAGEAPDDLDLNWSTIHAAFEVKF